MTVPALLPRPRLLDSCPALLGCNFPSQRPILPDSFGAVPLAQDLGSQEGFPPGPRDPLPPSPLALPSRFATLSVPTTPSAFLPRCHPTSPSPSLLSPRLRTPTSCSPWGPSTNHCAPPVHACGPAHPLSSPRPATHHGLLKIPAGILPPSRRNCPELQASPVPAQDQRVQAPSQS